MRELWDEGRVLGLSAYEQFVKQFKEINPTLDPPSERAWLASSLATGSSLLVSVPSNQGTQITSFGGRYYYTLDIQLPADTSLRAANTIFAAPFFGNGISSYGVLIDNPDGIATDGQSADTYVIDDPTHIEGVGEVNANLAFDQIDLYRNRLEEYLKIEEGVILQAGTWTKTSNSLYDFAPNLSIAPILRLRLSEKIALYPPTIILTGFTCSAVIEGVSGIDSSMDTPAPQDYDYLGPAVYPWTAKVIFTLNTENVRAINKHISQNLVSITEGSIVISDI